MIHGAFVLSHPARHQQPFPATSTAPGAAGGVRTSFLPLPRPICTNRKAKVPHDNALPQAFVKSPTNRTNRMRGYPMPNVFSSPRKRLRPLKLPPLVEPLGNIVSGAVFVSALLLMAIGVWLMLPFETMQRATPLMRFMAGALPEEIWGLLFLTFGAFQAKVMLWGPVVQRRAAARVALAFLLFLLIVAISEEPYSLLVPIFIILCAAEATALFGFNKRLARHARIEAAITQTLTP